MPVGVEVSVGVAVGVAVAVPVGVAAEIVNVKAQLLEVVVSAFGTLLGTLGATGSCLN